jgi:hypothetical protein
MKKEGGTFLAKEDSPTMVLIVLDCISTWCQTHHLLTIKFEYHLMSAVPESGATHIASVAESASSAHRQHPQVRKH